MTLAAAVAEEPQGCRAPAGLISIDATLARRLTPLSQSRERDLVAMDLTPSTPLAEIATHRPDLMQELERLGLDDCSGGKRSLAVACDERGLDPGAITAQLNGIPVVEAPAADWNALTPAELVDHLEATHHRYFKQELPRLSELAAKVSRVHGEKHPERVQAAAVLAEIRADLEPHLQKEKQVLFPMIRSLDTASSRPSFHCGSIANPISVMEQEHTAVGALRERLREITNGYQAPADTCSSTRRLIRGPQAQLVVLNTSVVRGLSGTSCSASFDPDPSRQNSMSIHGGSRQILIHGMALILAGLVWGLVIPGTPFPRLALGAHIQFVTNGLLFMLLATVLLALPHRVGIRSIWAMVVAAWLTWGMAVSEVANAWWGTTQMLPISASQAGAVGADSWQEMIVVLTHISAGLGLIVAWALLLIGFLRNVTTLESEMG